MRIQLQVLPAAILTCVAGVAAAQATADDSVLEEIFVVAKRLTPIQSAPATVSVIDQQDIARTMSEDIRELARYQPGISVRNDPVRFGIDSFAIRGIGGDRVVAEIDGVGVAESFNVGALADSGRIFTDLDFVRRVEILRGPASALYGSDAIGGVVRFQTLDPIDLLRAGERFASRASLGYRGDTDGWSATTLNAWSGQAVQSLVGYVHRQSHEADIAGGLDPNPRDSRSDQALVKLVIPGGGHGAIEIALEAGRTRDKTVVNALLGTPPRFVNTLSMRGDDTAKHLRLHIEQSLDLNGWWADDVVWRLCAQRADTEQITHEERRAAPPRTPPTQLQRAFELKDAGVGAEITAAKAFAAGAWSHQLVYGFEADAGRITERRNGYERNLNTQIVTPVILGEVFPLRDFPITDRFEAGVYLQDEAHRAGSRWRFTPGLRFDLYRLRPREDAMYREDNPNARPVGIDEQALAPKFALAYELSAHTNAFAQYARGFRSPPFEDVNIGLEIPLFNYRALPNPDLRAETSDGFEIGLRTRQAAWRATLSAFYTKFEDFIESRVNLGRDPVSGATLFQSRNVEHARMFGVELESRVDVGALTPRLSGWSLGFNAAWARGDNAVTDQPLNSIEPPKGTLIVAYEHAAGWGAQLVATAVASKDRVTEADTPLFRTDSYAVLDTFAYLPIGDRGQLSISVENLTDQSYIDWVDVRGRAANDPLVRYATHPGRNASVKLSFSF